MMCDAFRRLRFGTVSSYQYVGLGSVYFSDFTLFHRALGINTMFSIEEGDGDEQRFIDNLPFSSIKMLWGNSKTELPKVDLTLRTLAWLDYDGRLSRDVLDDIGSFVARVSSGSVLTISVQCHPEKYDDSNPRRAVEAFADEFGSECVDPALGDASLLGWGTAKFFRSVICNQITSSLAARNGVRPADQKIEYQQIFNFHYQDGARMLTVGGVFFDRGQKSIFDHCAFGDLPFVREAEDAFLIEIPKLTSAEIKRLEVQMPLLGGTVDHSSMPAKDAAQFVRIYRYFPNFISVDFS
jgi:hypothetical protein